MTSTTETNLRALKRDACRMREKALRASTNGSPLSDLDRLVLANVITAGEQLLTDLPPRRARGQGRGRN